MAVRNIDLGKKAKNEILETYPQAEIKLEVLDISNPKSVQDFIEIVKVKYHTIDVLINNAGINNAGVTSKGAIFDTMVFDSTF